MTLLDKVKSLISQVENETEKDGLKKKINRINESISLSMLCDECVKKGVIVPLNIKEYSLYGTYLITDITHNITSYDEEIDISIKRLEYYSSM